jgi:hypothetical protein
MSTKGIKEISELIDGVEAVGVPVAKALADGTVNAADLPHLMDLVKNHQKILDAVNGLDEVIPEAKDIDTLEAVALVQKLFSVAKNIKEAAKA